MRPIIPATAERHPAFSPLLSLLILATTSASAQSVTNRPAANSASVSLRVTANVIQIATLPQRSGAPIISNPSVSYRFPAPGEPMEIREETKTITNEWANTATAPSRGSWLVTTVVVVK